LKGEPLTVFGDGEQTRAFSYIDDVAPIIAKSIDYHNAYQEVFNIGEEIPCSINQLIKTISNVMDVAPKIIYLPERKEVKYAFSSRGKLNKIFGWQEPTLLLIGITRMANWVQKIGSRKTNKFTNIEIPFGLPEGW
jgi:UDP-glucose 4-epimerase